MGTLDAVLLIIMAVAAVFGAIKGVVRQIGMVVAVMLGVGLALRHGAAVATWLGRWIASPQARNVVGPALVFLAVYLAVIAGASLLHRLLAKASLGCINRAAGAAMGVAAAVLLMGAVLLLAVAHVPSTRPGIAHSAVAMEVMRGSKAMVGLVPPEVRRAFTQGWVEVQAIIGKYRSLPGTDIGTPRDSIL